jgi:predicted amidohydrolase
MSALRVAMLQWEVRPCAGLAGWAVRLEHEVTHAANHGARLLLMPEYAPLEMAAGPVPDVDTELRAAIELAPLAIEVAREVAWRHRVWLVPGSLPFRDGDRVVNRAPLIAPSGHVAFQDKHVMTRFEAEEWGIDPGAPPGVFDTRLGRIGIAVCFDAEFPTLVRAQVEAGAWLILVPSATDTLHGFHRVRVAAAARAMENQCYVCMAPTVGAAPWSATLDCNRGYAAAFGPVDRGFPEDGELARGALDAAQWVYVDLDPARLAAVRHEGDVRNHLSWPPTPPPCPVIALG